MNAGQARGRGNKPKPTGPLRKPGVFHENVSQEDEKPPVQKLEQTVNEAAEIETTQFPQGLFCLLVSKFVNNKMRLTWTSGGHTFDHSKFQGIVLDR